MNARLDQAGRMFVTCAAVAGIGSAVLAGGACYKDRNIECCMLSSLATTVCPDDSHNNCEEGGTCCNDIIDPSNVVAHYSQGGPGKVHVTAQAQCEARTAT